MKALSRGYILWLLCERGYSHLKEEALDRTMWRARFGRGFGSVVSLTTKLMMNVRLKANYENSGRFEAAHFLAARGLNSCVHPSGSIFHLNHM
jgi:hypothetical protein